jgi:hypothetical protein
MSYYEKYLKYKNKYINLRNQLGGEITIPNINNPCFNQECLICRELIESKYNDFIKISCGCCLHNECFVYYFNSDFGGTFKFICSTHNYVELPRDDIIRYFSNPDGSFDASKGITEDRYNRYEELTRPQEREMMVSSSEPYITATTKNCPECQFQITHYHGHGCHHIKPGTGCVNCKTHFCFKCLSKGSDNLAFRGSENCCTCESRYWSTFCSDIENYDQIGLEPVPFDKRCGCVFCPECSKDKPCGQCDGKCVVCIGMVPPGVTEFGAGWDINDVDLLARDKVYERRRNLGVVIEPRPYEANNVPVARRLFDDDDDMEL